MVPEKGRNRINIWQKAVNNVQRGIAILPWVARYAAGDDSPT
ncbi:hypothetical protein ACLB1O_04020 [Escherichia coli]